MTGFDSWRAAPADGDELLDTVAGIAAMFERPFAEGRVKKGLALDEDGFVPLDQIDHALDAVGLRCHLVRRPLAGWNTQDVPAILLVDGERPLILTDLDGDACSVRLPGASADVRVDRALLEAAYSGQGVIVRHDPSSEAARERPWDEAAKHHWFWSEVWKERGQYAYVMLASFLISLLAFAMPLFTMNVYDRIIPNKAASSLWVLALGAMFAIAVEYGLRLARTGLIDEVGRGIDARLSQRLLDKVLNLPLATQRGSTGALARRVTEYEQVRDFFASTTVVLVTDIFFLFVFVGLIAVLGGWLAVIPIVSMAIMLVMGWLLQRRMSLAVADAQVDTSLLQTTLIESIGSLETVKACRAEGRMLGKWRRLSASNAYTQEEMRKLTATAVNLATLCQQGTSIALIIGGFYLFNAGIISMGAIIAIVMLASRSLAPVGQLAFLMTRGRQAFVTLNSLQLLMDQEDEREKGSRSITPEIRSGRLQLDHAGFHYPDTEREALADISLTIEPGERIGLIGRVASGKSTLGRLLCGLYDPTAGSYRIDGLESRQYDPHDLRETLRFVGQDAELFSGTVRENLLVGANEANDAAIIEAVKWSGADAFIGRDATGFDFHIGERGSRLSGGQRSFLVLARALVTPAHLLFLDEPTGAMDSQTEQLFVDRLRTAIPADQTLILATHRMAVLNLVDRLIVMDNGRIVADGPRDEILAQRTLS
ncbi:MULTISPECIES: type I secretion system permease/ATPase [unclassified Sphingopyxis]|uniref:type I secretion system permease/ATPase n=1 Tax=unclassified Sphingopyxis TaxID=2614943 RepID=UPI000731750F|nr:MULTISPECIES: type I secretion system permease/ATPase [unclassified Sphingopyxis]KTE24822.1 ATP-binding protein [Sphingopyxis sp. H057]KTE49653.1 ATP-binding protein [Sphingopyxis sp. H071]KTE50847.1 ATP-binding protein [Sphingopyxis sp. H073]KTE57143.1 ATP-binding protein [Sphingopyxis sp. H107]KTE62154.1 ATP-binding protein [Sphingopyxis sp. H100]